MGHYLDVARPGCAVAIVIGHASDALGLVGGDRRSISRLCLHGPQRHAPPRGGGPRSGAVPRGAGALALADNVLEPGAPVYAWRLSRLAGTVEWAMCEFLRPEAEDWQALSLLAASTLG